MDALAHGHGDLEYDSLLYCMEASASCVELA